MTAGGLFDELPDVEAPGHDELGVAGVRVSRPDRGQIGWEMVDLDQLIGADHPVRLVTAFVEKLDLSPFYRAIKTRQDGPGRDGIDPALLMGLWLFATVDGVGSARELARLCTRDLPYRWLCGGVGVNHHALSDFRTDHVELLDRLLTDSVTALVADGLVSLEHLAHDGMRVRASAGASSFRRGARLGALRAAMEERVQRLRAELEDAPDASQKRKLASAARAAGERLERCRQAQARLKELEAARAKQPNKKRTDPKTGKDRPVRVSTTDPQARVIPMAAGEFRPAYNIQLSCDPATLVAVAVSVHDSGVDAGQLRPALEQIEKRYQKRPSVILADCGFCSKEDISWSHLHGVKAIVPSNAEARLGDLAYATTYRGHMPGVTEWRQRMVDPAAQELYKMRGMIECVFAQLRNFGLRFLRLRGVEKVRSEVLLYLLAHNMMCAARLRSAAA
jgi:transposase